MSKKKSNQLGMNSSTASAILVKDLLFSFVKDRQCYRCGEALTRATFSIDHVVPWLNSENPTELFFDLDNIAISHNTCNTKAARKFRKYATIEERKEARSKQESASWRSKSPEERKAHRRARYLKYGK